MVCFSGWRGRGPLSLDFTSRLRCTCIKMIEDSIYVEAQENIVQGS